ncbi:MAG TPA: hypothetical protein VIJ82_08655 [Streptosporangiaceae bacterium]
MATTAPNPRADAAARTWACRVCAGSSGIIQVCSSTGGAIKPGSPHAMAAAASR